MRFSDKGVLVAGAGRGMGRAIGLALAEERAKVVVSARTAKYGEQTVTQIAEAGGTAFLVLGDVADRPAVKAMIDSAVEKFGGLDVVVHCAADAAHGLIAEMPDEVFSNLVNCNIQSVDRKSTRLNSSHVRISY